MCYQVTCTVCGKTGWQGCGQHVDEVMRNVPPSQRCTCQSAGAAGTPKTGFTTLMGARRRD